VSRFAVLGLAAAILALLIPMQAQSFTYGRLVAGQLAPALAYGTGTSWCLVDNGNTDYQINQTNTKAVISFAELIYFDGTTYYSLDGQTRMIFNSASDGIIHFKQALTYPDSVNAPPFVNFVQTYNPSNDRLIVSFTILFPNCTLPISAVYDAP